MLKRGILAVLAAAFVFACGYWLGRERTVSASANRVFELRTYTANEGKFDGLQARFRNHTLRIFEKHGMQNVGYWTPADGPTASNTLIYLLAYKDREAAKKAWESFRSDPDWKKVQGESEASGRLVGKVESVYLVPTDYSPMK
jgi:hypothetical protein